MHNTRSRQKKFDPIAAAVRRPYPLVAFKARAEARAALVRAGKSDAQVEINVLLADAARSGLLADMGEGVLYAVIAVSFASSPYREGAA
jgi:hypothetical protein